MENLAVPEMDEETMRRVVGSILVRLQRYVRGYLPDLRIETDEDFSKNPAEVKIRVWSKERVRIYIRKIDALYAVTNSFQVLAFS